MNKRKVMHRNSATDCMDDGTQSLQSLWIGLSSGS